MTATNGETRLDALVAELAAARPHLDDVTRARVGHRLEAAHVAPATAARRRRVPWALGAAGAAAAVIAMALGAGGDRSSEGAPAPAPVATAAPAELVEGTTLVAAADTSVHGELDGSRLTLYGPGWARREAGTILVDAQAVVVDRPRGDTALEVRYGAASIRVIRATFAVDGGTVARVSVMRGVVELACGADAAVRAIAAGDSASCATERTAVIDPPVPAAPPVVAAAAPAAAPIRPRAIASVAPVPAPDPVLAPPAAPEPSPPPVDDVATRYAAAEQLMRTDRPAARRALRDLVAAHATAAEAAPALLDLARLAHADGDGDDALAALDQLAHHPDGARLAMPAHYLRCLVQLRVDRAAARACLAEFRAAFPGSVHDADVLARLATATAATDCAAATPLLAEYLGRYPAGAQAPAVTRWRARCNAR